MNDDSQNTPNSNPSSGIQLLSVLAREAMTLFPKLRKNTIFVNRPTGEFFCDSAALGNCSKVIEDALQRSWETYSQIQGGHVIKYLSPHNCQFLFVNAEASANSRDYYFSTNMQEEIRGIFNHELGHLMVPGGYPEPEEFNRITLSSTIHSWELKADAYGALRFIQHNSIQHGERGYHRGLTASISYHIYPSHIKGLSTPVVDRIVIDSKTADFISLSPQKTVRLAQRYAERYRPSEEDVMQLIQDTDPLHKEVGDFWDDHGKAYVQNLAKITLAASPLSLTFHVAARWLDALLNIKASPDNYVYQYLEGNMIDLTGEHWDNIRRQFKEKAADAWFAPLLESFKENGANITAAPVTARRPKTAPKETPAP